MKTHRRKTNRSWYIGTAAVAALLATPALTRADDPYTMAPPVQGDQSDAGYADQGPADTTDNASQDSVFNWSEVPADQKVPITRAAFDQGGYQLYDAVGETIVVPFADNNLYVMKFGLSDDGTAYFVNDGNEPVLYLPQDAYLENATVPGAKWYPFPQNYQPTAPVFLGVAPSWDDYVNMGWYPNAAFYGGYYCNGPFFAGIHIFPTIGLTFVIGEHSFHDWDAYHSYYHEHDAPYRIGFHDRAVYHWANHDYAGGRTFDGGRGPGQWHGGYHGTFDNGGFHPAPGGHPFQGGYGSRDNGSFGTGNHDFGNHDFGNHDFGGNAQNQPGHTFSGFGGRPDSSGSPSFGGHTFNSGTQGFGGRTFGSGNQGFGGGQRFGGPSSNGYSGRTFGWGQGSNQNGGSRHARGGSSPVSTDHQGQNGSGGQGNGGQNNDDHGGNGGWHGQH